MRPYQMLSRYYISDWATYGLQYARLIPWIVNEFKYPISNIVDLACGMGALLNELHKSGYKVIGVDISPEMIGLARKINPNIEYIIEDIAIATIKDKVDLAICSFDSLNYLTDEDHLLKALKNVRLMLKEGAFFAFDINTPFLYEEKQQGTIDREVHGVKFKQILTYDKNQRISTTVFDFGEGVREVHIQKAYDLSEMKEYLGRVGFNVEGTYEDFAPHESSEKCYKPIFIARIASEKAG